jgi:capsular polysaccharide biosynthesis protein
LVTEYGDVYGHFIHDVLPRLELIKKAGFNLADVDHIFCRKPPPGNAWRLLDLLNVPMSKFIWTDSMTALRPDTLLAPSFPGIRMNYPKWVPEFLQREFLPSRPTPTRRLYVSRAGFKRNPVNAETVNRILVHHGFEIYQPSDHIDSHIDFSQASMVVGADGSGLVGIAFCQPGTKVLELLPTDHTGPFFYTLTDAAGLDYGCLVCRSQKDQYIDHKPSPYDFYVDEKEFEAALSRITGDIGTA